MTNLTPYLNAVRDRLAKETSQPLLVEMIASLEQYRKQGVNDPWLLSDGTVIQPVDVLKELWMSHTDLARLLAVVEVAHDVVSALEECYCRCKCDEVKMSLENRCLKHDALTHWQMVCEKQ